MEDAGTWLGEYGGIFRVNKPTMDEDHLLVERVALGDRRALDEVYVRFGEALFGYLLALTQDRQLAEEILQDTLVAVWQGAGSFRGLSSAKTWIFGVARRQTHNAMRRRALPLVEEDEIKTVPASDLGPEDILLDKVRKEELGANIDCLSPVHREILTLIFFNGLSYQESAEILGVRSGTVKSRLYNAKKALRGLLENPREEGR